MFDKLSVIKGQLVEEINDIAEDIEETVEVI